MSFCGSGLQQVSRDSAASFVLDAESPCVVQVDLQLTSSCLSSERAPPIPQPNVAF